MRINADLKRVGELQLTMSLIVETNMLRMFVFLSHWCLIFTKSEYFEI